MRLTTFNRLIYNNQGGLQMLTVIFWARADGRPTQARINAESISREFKKSIRFNLPGGKTITIAKADILTIKAGEN